MRPKARARWSLLLSKSVALVGFAALLPLMSCDKADEGDPPPPDSAAPLGPDEIRLKIAQQCPGDPSCPEGSDDKLLAGVGFVDITPPIEQFTDNNKNGVWDEGEPYTDTNGNRVFDGYWMAGFGNGRLAYDVHDPIWARAIALRQNQTTVVMVAVDALGLFAEETAEVQKLLDPKLDIDLLLLSATHVHQNADLVGGWGPDVATSGINPSYQKLVRQGIAQAVTKAITTLVPTRVSLGSIAVEEGPNHDMRRYVSDTRDPVVIDNTLHTIQFLDLSNTPPRPVATIVNWAHHPESVGSENHSITSDFVYFLRDELEKKGAGPVIYVSGALGGQIGPGRVEPVDDMGQVVKQEGFKKAELIGRSVAKFALNAIADPNARVVEGKDAKLRFRTAGVAAQIANLVYHFAQMLGIYKRTTCCYDTSRPIGDDNLPSVETRVAYLQLGPASIITNPGELLPELFLGGYSGDHAGTYQFIDMMQPNYPDVSKAPKPPYLIDLMDGERAHRMTFGLTMDFLGYIVPRYNWVLDADKPYFEEAKGDHYEETNSIGPLAEPQIVGTMRQLIQAKGEAK